MIKLTGIVQIVCLFFFLLAILAWCDLIAGKAHSYGKVIICEILALLTFEYAVILPVILLSLNYFLVPDKKARRYFLARHIIPLILISGVIFLLLLSGQNSSHAVQMRIADPFSKLPPKLLSLLRMFFVPLLVWEKGFWGMGIFDGRIARFIVLLIFTGSLGAVSVAGGTWKKREKAIPFPVLGFLIGWIGITVLPYMFQALTFEHATRCLYFPMVGFSILVGGFLSLLMNSEGKYAAVRGFIGVISLTYILGINIVGTAFHYRRYEEYLSEHKSANYSGRMKELFDAQHNYHARFTQDFHLAENDKK